MEDLTKRIRDVADFPKKGIIFKDITPLLKDPESFSRVIAIFEKQYGRSKIDVVAGIEARGFIFGAVLAYRLKCGFVPVRKKGKLPYKTITAEYSKEYGLDYVEIHEDAVKKGDRVLIIDDLLATGGTVGAAVTLFKKLDTEVAGAGFVVELQFLKGREALKGVDIFSIIKF